MFTSKRALIGRRAQPIISPGVCNLLVGHGAPHSHQP
ncbi:hypothetical protein Pmani_037422, partial [Petrolisthes manimaculis]